MVPLVGLPLLKFRLVFLLPLQKSAFRPNLFLAVHPGLEAAHFCLSEKPIRIKVLHIGERAMIGVTVPSILIGQS